MFIALKLRLARIYRRLVLLLSIKGNKAKKKIITTTSRLCCTGGVGKRQIQPGPSTRSLTEIEETLNKILRKRRKLLVGKESRKTKENSGD